VFSLRFDSMNNQTVLRLLVALAVVSLTISFLSHALSQQVNWLSWADGAFQNFSTEMMGAIVTFGLFELILGARQREADKAETINREKQQQAFFQRLTEESTFQQQSFFQQLTEQNQKQIKQQTEQRLITQTASQDHSIALSAVDEIRARGWLQGSDSILINAFLNRANLMHADLHNANLIQAHLWNADLSYTDLTRSKLIGARIREAKLVQAKLQEADLSNTRAREADFSGAHLLLANFTNADLWLANFSNANLHGAIFVNAHLRDVNFTEADLSDADLTGADLRRAKITNVQWGNNFFGEIQVATLPDGKEWSSDTDMARFTDSQHAQFETTWSQINAKRSQLDLEPLE